MRFTSTLDGCMIEEHFDATPGNPLVGRSIASWDAQSREWKQTWIDNFGSHFAFTGGIEDGRMTLTAPYMNAGKRSLHRRVWSAVTSDSFEWDWVTSDDGHTWRTAWRFTATRSAAPSAAQGEHDTVHSSTDARANTIIGIMRLRSASGDSLVMGETILLSATADGVTMRANPFSPELRVAEDTAMTLQFIGGTADSLHFVSTHGPTMDTFCLRRGMDAHEARSVIHRADGRDQVISLTYCRRK